MILLEIKNLIVEFQLEGRTLRAVDELNFSLEKGKVLGIVGESGSGKSVTALSLLRLIDPPGKISQGRILYYPEGKPHADLPALEGNLDLAHFDPIFLPPRKKRQESSSQGIDLLKLSEREMLKIRGNRIAMVFQDPMTSLNPVYTIGNQIEEAILTHQKSSKKEAREKTIEILRQVGIADAERRIHDYPYQMSGGMRQRVMIAMALSCEPQILIADEPTTALDVTIQAQILELIREIIEARQMSMILITHDLGVVAQTCDSVLVMYAGQGVEQAPSRVLFSRPKHPYTIGLLESIPAFQKVGGARLKTIPGGVPNLLQLPAGCRFQARCPRALPACSMKPIPMRYLGEQQRARCINY